MRFLRQEARENGKEWDNYNYFPRAFNSLSQKLQGNIILRIRWYAVTIVIILRFL